MCADNKEKSHLASLANSIPGEAWVVLVKSATDTVQKLLYPITASTEGVGRLTESKLARYTEEEKILAADTLNSAYQLVLQKNESVGSNYKPKVILNILEQSAIETDLDLREVWAKLLATELIDGSVHPEIPNILRRMTGHDAKLFQKIFNGQNKLGKKDFKEPGNELALEMITVLGLIKPVPFPVLGGKHDVEMTNIGKAFGRAVNGGSSNF